MAPTTRAKRAWIATAIVLATLVVGAGGVSAAPTADSTEAMDCFYVSPYELPTSWYVHSDHCIPPPNEA